MLLNIDKPLNRGTLHAQSCEKIPQPTGSRLKPLGTLGKDGGWFPVEDESRAQESIERLWPAARLVRCSVCQPSKG